ncbi:hypothetical protein PVAP13_1NG441900 [Panicum virgatum]|uniref:Uncharacterized protein n=3 Tax=Panicum TaxID=4539 RepID=A0A8T0WZJ3_PANVG|nr:hypothetical protein PVAP13_1NG441900 [Panicum virgatum]
MLCPRPQDCTSGEFGSLKFIRDMEKVVCRAYLLQCKQFFSKETLDWAPGNTHLSSLVNYT